MTVDPGVVRRWVTIDDERWTQCHASSVLRTDGATLATWFAGTREGTPDNQIWMSRRSDDEDTWGPAVALTDEPVAHWNPVLATGPDRAVWLFYKQGARISQWATWFRRSTDQGRTWSAPAELVPGDEGGRGPVKNPPLLLEDGVWLAPASLERWEGRGRWDSFVDRSTDGGRTWSISPIPLDHEHLRGAGVIQPALWQAGGAVHALMRSTEGRAFHSSSTDGGRTWSPARPTALGNNNSALTVVSLPDGRIACVHNPVSGDWAARCPLSVSVSADGGTTWQQRLVLEDGATPIDDDPARAPAQPPPAAPEDPLFDAGDGGVVTSGLGEYSYPAATISSDGVPQMVVTYTWQRRGVVEARVPLARL